MVSHLAKNKGRGYLAKLKRDQLFILMALPGVLYYFIFHYLPMYGVWMAFTNYDMSTSILASEFVGFKWFMQFFSSYFFVRLLRNTLMLSLLNILWGFPLPILFALTLNEVRNARAKKLVQTISYLPHFISIVVVVGIMSNTLSPTEGVISRLMKGMGKQPISFMTDVNWFRTLYVGSNVWQSFGWNSIIYLAAIAGVDPQLYEAATIDGASRFKQILYVTLPSILPTVILLLILQVGSIMSVGYEKIILMYSPSTYEKADVINTYVYRRGILNSEYSFGAAVGVFNNAINMILVLATNAISRRVSDVGLW